MSTINSLVNRAMEMDHLGAHTEAEKILKRVAELKQFYRGDK